VVHRGLACGHQYIAWLQPDPMQIIKDLHILNKETKNEVEDVYRDLRALPFHEFHI